MRVLSLAPQNLSYILQATEAACAACELALQFRMFSTVVDPNDGDSSEEASCMLGIQARGYLGVLFVTWRETFASQFTTHNLRTALLSIPPPRNVDGTSKIVSVGR